MSVSLPLAVTSSRFSATCRSALLPSLSVSLPKVDRNTPSMYVRRAEKASIYRREEEEEERSVLSLFVAVFDVDDQCALPTLTYAAP